MAHKAMDIAKWFINRAMEDVEMVGGEFMTNIKLQKMLYFAQGCYGAMADKRLFEEDIVHWMHGPAVEKVFEAYAHWGDKGMDKREICPNFDNQTKKILEEVYSVYGEYSALGLRNFSQTHKPMQETENCQVIPFERIVEFFKSELVEF